MYGLCLPWHVLFVSEAVGMGQMMNEDTAWFHARPCGRKSPVL